MGSFIDVEPRKYERNPIINEARVSSTDAPRLRSMDINYKKLIYETRNNRHKIFPLRVSRRNRSVS